MIFQPLIEGLRVHLYSTHKPFSSQKNTLILYLFCRFCDSIKNDIVSSFLNSSDYNIPNHKIIPYILNLTP